MSCARPEVSPLIRGGSRRCGVLVSGHPLEGVELDPGFGHPGKGRVPGTVPDEPASPSSTTSSFHPRCLSASPWWFTPPHGPVTRRASGLLPTVRRAGVGVRGSMMGTVRRRRVYSPIGLARSGWPDRGIDRSKPSADS